MIKFNSDHATMTNSKVIKSKWNTIPSEVPASVSLTDIMAEQIQESFHDKTPDGATEIQTLLHNSLIYDDSIHDPDCSRDHELARILAEEPDCTGDFEFAKQLQRQADREAELREKFQRSKNDCGIAKATLSSDPYIYMRRNESSEDEEDDDDIREFAINLLYEKYSLEFPACGFIRTSDGVYVTKHDREINERKNYAKAVYNDLVADNVFSGRLTEKVLNDLRSYRNLENRKHIRFRDNDEKATNASSVDAHTRLILLKWINNGDFDRIEGVIAMGKEAAVLHAVRDPSCRDTSSASSVADPTNGAPKIVPISGTLSGTATEVDKMDTISEDCAQCSIQPLNGSCVGEGCTSYAVKVFRTSLPSFRNRSEYVKDNFRFKNPRRVMKIWAKKEFMNLQRLRRSGIMCPTPIRLRNHALLMSLIGKEKAAEKLKDVVFTDNQTKFDVFRQVREIVNRMFKESKLVHGDLSEFNMLWHNDTVYVIDVAQAMDTSNSRAFVFLLKDIFNILEFFGRIGTEDLPSAKELFTEVTGLDIGSERNLFCEVENFECENRSANLRQYKSRPADVELQIYEAECMDRSVSPARAFN